MKKFFAFVMAVALLLTSFAALAESEKIHIVAPKTGYNEDEIATANEKETGLSYSDKAYIGVVNNVAEKYPDYEMEYVDWGWAEALDQKQRSMFAAGTYPDIVAGEVFMPEYASEGLLEPLPQDIIDTCNPSFFLYDNDNVPVGVAYKTSVFLLFYNKDILAAAGLDPETPPTTWAEWKEMSDKVTEWGNGEIYGGGVPTFPHAGGALRATPFFRQAGVDFYKDGESMLTSEALQEVLAFIDEMDKNFPAGLGNGNEEDPLWNAFHDGKIAFVVNGSWEESSCITNNINYGVAQLPTKDGTAGNCTVGTVYLAVPKGAANKDASFNVIRETIALNVAQEWLGECCCPPLNEVIDNPSYYESSVTLTMEMEALKNGVYTGVCTYPKNNSQIWEIINQQVLQRLTMTDDDIATICAEAEEQVQALLK